jgi:cell division septation protein DedD
LSLPSSSPAEAAAKAGAPAATPGPSEAAEEPPTAAAGAASAGKREGSPSVARSAKEGHWFVQAAALSSESAARQLSERLSKAGMTPFVERTETGGAVLYRVRLGPFSSRDGAVKARRHLHAMDVVSNVVRVEQAER